MTNREISEHVRRSFPVGLLSIKRCPLCDSASWEVDQSMPTDDVVSEMNPDDCSDQNCNALVKLMGRRQMLALRRMVDIAVRDGLGKDWP